ncbi:MAG: rhomboid family protein [Actinomycetia bacterium]|nr:rhomboid family protein [Actinomycetes bacterium]
MTTPETCFHHHDRETGRHCTRCGRPACASCLREASVGSQCWECVKDAAPPRTEQVRRTLRGATMPVTKAIIAANVAVFLLMAMRNNGNIEGTRAQTSWALYGPAVAHGEWYRLVSSGFIHFGILHIAFNMLILYQVGLVLESASGSSRFATLYATSLLTGSLGALIASPHALSGGASGAVFGVAAAATVAMYRQGVSFWQTGFGPLLAINLVLSFVIPNVSYGAHIGGLIGGALAAEGMIQSRRLQQPWLGYAIAIAISAIAVAASLAIAPST